MIAHHKGGCINCGGARTDKSELLVKLASGSKMRLGVCKDCWDDVQEFDLDELKNTLYEQERQLLITQNKPECLADQIKSMQFASCEKA